MSNDHFKEEMLSELNSKEDLKLTFKKIFNSIENFETMHYGEILSLEMVYLDFIKIESEELLSSLDTYDIEMFFQKKRMKLAYKIIDEQKRLFQENYRDIKKRSEEIRELLLSNNIELAVESFNKLFSGVHSRHFNVFIEIFYNEYNPMDSKLEIFENNRRFRLISLRDNVLFEKKLILLEQVTSNLFQDQDLQSTIQHFQQGQFLEGLKKIEKKYAKLISLDIPKSLDIIIRTPTVILYNYLYVLQKLNSGLISYKRYITLKIELAAKLIELHERNFKIDMGRRIQKLVES
ncbi:MAG: hypothetical protein P1U56_03105 [Saprospiraceae bacterium]|nr:hypothetical protein [Saprospiraceae bacterium]